MSDRGFGNKPVIIAVNPIFNVMSKKNIDSLYYSRHITLVL